MFHKIKSVRPMENYFLFIQFSEGVCKKYDMKPWFDLYPKFNSLKENNHFNDVKVDIGGVGIIWDDELDLNCEDLYQDGIIVPNPFDGMLSFGDACQLWGLNESTLRKAVSYGKLIEGIDVCKFGKQWVILMNSMIREYGNPK